MAMASATLMFRDLKPGEAMIQGQDPVGEEEIAKTALAYIKDRPRSGIVMVTVEVRVIVHEVLELPEPNDRQRPAPAASPERAGDLSRTRVDRGSSAQRAHPETNRHARRPQGYRAEAGSSRGGAVASSPPS
jgi:hypothetical protein